METLPKAKLRLEKVNLYTTLQGQQQGYPILQDISFEVFEGDRIAIVGPSGAGKSYLLRLLNRLSEPSDGKIHLDNQEYRQIPVLQLRTSVTLVPQESKLLGMTVKDALAYPLILRGLPKQTIQQRISNWIEQLHIPDDWLGKTEVQLSGGQRQLIAITRALIIEPQILLLDEPTSALDLGTASRVMAILTQLAQNRQTTVLMVNHQLEMAEIFCDRLLHLQQGRLISNQSATSINWAKLRKSLIQAQTQTTEEWG